MRCVWQTVESTVRHGAPGSTSIAQSGGKTYYRLIIGSKDEVSLVSFLVGNKSDSNHVDKQKLFQLMILVAAYSITELQL